MLENELDEIQCNNNTSASKNQKPNKKRKEKDKLSQAFKAVAKINGEKLDTIVTKKEGTFELAGEAVLKVDEKTFIRSTTVSSLILPPNKRQDISMSLQYQDCLCSEIFIIFSRYSPKKPVQFELPTIQQTRHSVLKAGMSYVESMSCKYCCVIKYDPDSMNWTQLPSEKIEWTATVAKFKSQEWGIFAIYKSAPRDTIKIDRNGGVFYSSIDPLFLMTVPKFACENSVKYNLQVFDVDEVTLEDLSHCYPGDLSNIVNISNFFSFSFFKTTSLGITTIEPIESFSRPVTIRLSLPNWIPTSNSDNEYDCLNGAFLYVKRYGKWEKLKTIISCTSMTFTFSTKYLGTFVLVEPRPNRVGKMKNSIMRVEHLCRSRIGVILTFLKVEPKHWYLMIDAVVMDRIESLKNKRFDEGFVLLEQNISKLENQIRYLGQKKTQICNRLVELIDGASFTVGVSEYLQIKPTSYSPYLISKNFSNTLTSTFKKQAALSPTFSNYATTSKVINSTAVNPSYISLGKSKQNSPREHVESIKNVSNNPNNNAKKAMDRNNEKKDLSEHHFLRNDSNVIKLVYYSCMEENYRIVELEPRPINNLHDDIVHKLKRWSILQEDYQEQQDLEIEHDEQRRLSTYRQSTISLFAFSKKSINQTLSNVRMEPPSEMHQKFMFPATITVTSSSQGISIPPNENNEDLKQKPGEPSRILFKTSDIHKADNKFKFYINPEEMREYLSLAKPSPSDIKAIRFKLMDEICPGVLKQRPMTQNDESHDKDENFIELEKITDFKVLNNNSFEVLSYYVKAGLKLAHKLSLPDAMITQIGLDAVDSKQTYNDVTYHVLQKWRDINLANASKKRLPLAFIHLDLINQLFTALRNLRFQGIVDIMTSAVNKNTELFFDDMNTISS